MIASLRRWVRIMVPAGPRLAVARLRRGLRDRVSGDARWMARRRESVAAPLFRVVEIDQPIRMTAFAEGKLANIRLGAAALDGVTIAPGEIFSFWALVGEPAAAAGFALGRSIRGGQVGGEVGGGLCQVSGIAYELLLRGGLAPIERHPHSRDLYSEEERFTPLGLDATVVWPYRDVRFANRRGSPVTLRLAVEDDRLRATLHATEPLTPAIVAIARTDHPGHRVVEVRCDGALVSRDRYAVG